MKVFYGGIYLEEKALHDAGIEHPIKLEYYKTMNEEKNLFGIDIVKTEYKTNDIIKEEKQMKQLSNDEEKIDRMLSIFKAYEVSPITAQDVIDDLLKQNF